MVKEDIVRLVHEAHGGLPMKDVSGLVDNLVDTLKKTLLRENKVLISGFGKFEVKNRVPRRIADPNTGKPMHLPAKRAITFKASPELAGKVND